VDALQEVSAEGTATHVLTKSGFLVLRRGDGGRGTRSPSRESIYSDVILGLVELAKKARVISPCGSAGGIRLWRS
jgi:hypothetical protein